MIVRTLFVKSEYEYDFEPAFTEASEIVPLPSVSVTVIFPVEETSPDAGLIVTVGFVTIAGFTTLSVTPPFTGDGLVAELDEPSYQKVLRDY